MPREWRWNIAIYSNAIFFIDLISYRRHGHNEADEPLATQPMMYSIIKKHPTPRKVYADRLIAEGAITEEEAIEMMNLYRDALDTAIV